jgi:hypothetical protein
MKITQSQLKEIINEEVKKVTALQKLKSQKNLLNECIYKLENGQMLNEEEEKFMEGMFSWLKGAGKEAGKEIADRTAKAGQAIVNKASQAGQAIADTATQAVTAVRTKFANMEKGFQDIYAKLDQAGTKQEVMDLTNELTKILGKTRQMAAILNDKQKKVGAPITNYQSLVMKSVHQFKKQ